MDDVSGSGRSPALMSLADDHREPAAECSACVPVFGSQCVDDRNESLVSLLPLFFPVTC